MKDSVGVAPLNHAIRILVVMPDAGATKKEFQTVLVFRNSLAGRGVKEGPPDFKLIIV